MKPTNDNFSILVQEQGPADATPVRSLRKNKARVYLVNASSNLTSISRNFLQQTRQLSPADQGHSWDTGEGRLEPGGTRSWGFKEAADGSIAQAEQTSEKKPKQERKMQNSRAAHRKIFNESAYEDKMKLIKASIGQDADIQKKKTDGTSRVIRSYELWNATYRNQVIDLYYGVGRQKGPYGDVHEQIKELVKDYPAVVTSHPRVASLAKKNLTYPSKDRLSRSSERYDSFNKLHPKGLLPTVHVQLASKDNLASKSAPRGELTRGLNTDAPTSLSRAATLRGRFQAAARASNNRRVHSLRKEPQEVIPTEPANMTEQTTSRLDPKDQQGSVPHILALGDSKTVDKSYLWQGKPRSASVRLESSQNNSKSPMIANKTAYPRTKKFEFAGLMTGAKQKSRVSPSGDFQHSHSASQTSKTETQTKEPEQPIVHRIDTLRAETEAIPEEPMLLGSTSNPHLASGSQLSSYYCITLKKFYDSASDAPVRIRDPPFSLQPACPQILPL